MRYLTLAAIVLVLLAAPACDGPTAGELSIDLVTPNSDDGAILFKIRTPYPREFGELTPACSGCQAFAHRVNESELYCVVTGQLESGPLVRIVVSDLSPMSVYEVAILEIAGADRNLRSNVGYELRVAQ
jgi:hypothetical protein